MAEGRMRMGAECGATAMAAPHTSSTVRRARGRSIHAPDNSVLNDAHEVPNWVKVAPFCGDADRAGQWGGGSTVLNPSIPGRLAQNQRPLLPVPANKWYFDEIYNFAIVRPARWLGRTLWKGRRWRESSTGDQRGWRWGSIPYFIRASGGRGGGASSYIFTYASPW